MSCSDGTPIPSPHSSNLMKWVDQQAVRLPVPSKMIEVSLGIASATSQACPEAPQNSLAKPTFERCLTNAKPKVYDIATLYVLGREALRKNTELKVHTTSLKGKHPVALTIRQTWSSSVVIVYCFLTYWLLGEILQSNFMYDSRFCSMFSFRRGAVFFVFPPIPTHLN